MNESLERTLKEERDLLDSARQSQIQVNQRIAMEIEDLKNQLAQKELALANNLRNMHTIDIVHDEISTLASQSEQANLGFKSALDGLRQKDKFDGVKQL